VNFGLRYEFSSVLQEDTTCWVTSIPNSTYGLVQVQTGTNQIPSLYNPDHKNFAPRFGFAWDTNGRGRTVIRGGGGLVYETVNWQSFIAFNNAFGPGSVPTGASCRAAHHDRKRHHQEFPEPGPGTTWDNTPVYGNSTDRLQRQSLPHHDRGPQSDHSLRLELDPQRATRVYPEPHLGDGLRRQPRHKPDRHSRH
jgi:hypothetical protein